MQAAVTTFSSVGVWLDSMDLGQYQGAFQGLGYDTVEAVLATGVSDTLLDSLDITHPPHRASLQLAGTQGYFDGLQVSISRWQEIGPIVLFTVVARWKYYRSCTSMQFGDFQKLDLLIRRELVGDSALLERVPEMPVLGGEMVDLGRVQEGLNGYLGDLCGVLGPSPYLKSLLAFLDVIPATVGATPTPAVSSAYPAPVLSTPLPNQY
jgi:hypothetical protein